MASWFDTFDGLPEAAVILLMRNWLLMFRQLHGRALIVSYEQIDRRPWIAAWRIARAVCPTIGPVEVIRIARKFSKAEVKRRADQLARDAIDVTDIGFSYFDSATLFHRRHVASMVSRPAKKRLTPEQLTRIQEALAEDIKVAGLL